ncbi:PAS domain-containing protein [Candidatus Bathyarchaeota archaeon]|nr:PAS domain-containing protein [Candidatus Bathyarchaeota archaeon]
MMPSDITDAALFSLLENINEGIIVYTSEKIIWVNGSLVNMLSYDSPDDFIGKNIFSFIDFSNIQHATSQIEQLYMGKKLTGGVYKVKTKDGSLIPIVSRGSVLENGGEPTLISFIRLVSDEPIEAHLDISVPMLVNEVATALTVIRGYLELLHENPDDMSVKASYFEAITLNLNRIEENLLKFK